MLSCCRFLAPGCRPLELKLGPLAALVFAICHASTSGFGAVRIWSHHYNGAAINAFDIARGVVLDLDGNPIVLGESQGFGFQHVTLKYAKENGALLWTAESDASVDGVVRPFGASTDGAGNVIVVGNPGLYIAKYRTADGVLLWKRSNPTSLPLPVLLVTGFALDFQGNVLVIGYRELPEAYSVYFAKFSAEDGSLVWSDERTNGRRDEAEIRTDAAGDVLLAATINSDPPGKGSDIFVAKYGGRDGLLKWERRYNGPEDAADAVRALAVDSQGNPIVTALLPGPGDDIFTQGDAYTAKYASSDGSLLWERRYNGPARGRDEMKVIAIDANDNVIVSGQTVVPNVLHGAVAYYTAKYASTNGSVLWERLYHAVDRIRSVNHACCE